MFTELNKLRKNNLNNFYSIIIISCFPLFFLFSSLLTNLFTVILIFLFLSEIKLKPKNIIKDKIMLLLILFWFFILISLFTSIYFENSFSRSVGFLRFIFFSYALAYYFKLNNFRYFKIILLIWFFIFFITSTDLLIEYIFGHNLLGNSSYMPGRLSGFLGDELKIGNYYLGFYFLILVFSIQFFKNQLLSFSIIIFFSLIAILIGERSNSIKIILGLFIFLTFYEKIITRYKIMFLGIIISCALILINFNTDFKNRYKAQFYNPLKTEGIYNYIKGIPYGAHFSTAYEIFKQNPISGIGLKNFYFECGKDKYIDKEFAWNHSRCSTHPHQLHLEILSHIGIFGYLVFIYLFFYSIYFGYKNYLKNKNPYLLASLVFIFVSIFTPVPSGSFFTTYGATIFWLNFGVLLAFSSKQGKLKYIQ
jgi:O-antigen ligase